MKKLLIVSIYSIVHSIVDMACAMLMAGAVIPHITSVLDMAVALILYNMFAFAFQFPFGLFADKLNKNALVSAVGCGCVVVAYAVSPFKFMACVVAGIGNALFHVGGGIDVLNISDGKASLPGIYVATGALGLYIGSSSHSLGFANYYVMCGILLFAMVSLVWLYRKVKYTYCIENEKADIREMYGIREKINSKQIIMYCLLITICLRSYMGSILNFQWKSGFEKGLICVVAVGLGKMLGGIVGDRFGWRRVSTISLAISALLFVFAFDNMICGIMALMLFNMTMPITLTALANIFYHNRGAAFGMTTLALFIGAVPVIMGYPAWGFNEAGVCVMTLISTVVLFVGLMIYERVRL